MFVQFSYRWINTQKNPATAGKENGTGGGGGESDSGEGPGGEGGGG